MLASLDGDAIFVGLPGLTTAGMQHCLDHFAAERPTTLNIVLLYTMRCRAVAAFRLPQHVVPVIQPPYCLEVNPVERVWQHLKTARARQRLTTLHELHEEVVRLVQDSTAALLRGLTSYPYFVHVTHAVSA